MNEEALNQSIRKFLKVTGISSQREIEQAVARALQESTIDPAEPLHATMTLEVPGLVLRVTFHGELKLQ